MVNTIQKLKHIFKDLPIDFTMDHFKDCQYDDFLLYFIQTCEDFKIKCVLDHWQKIIHSHEDMEWITEQLNEDTLQNKCLLKWFSNKKLNAPKAVDFDFKDCSSTPSSTASVITESITNKKEVVRFEPLQIFVNSYWKIVLKLIQAKLIRLPHSLNGFSSLLYMGDEPNVYGYYDHSKYLILLSANH